MESYRTVRSAGVAEYVDRRSRFIGEARPVADEAQAAAFIEETRKKYWDARHHVPVYILRAGGVRRFSDDGEPQGTAGMPALDVLQKQALVDCAVVITRYFGGILLGGGGLVRAYSHTAALAIEAAGVVEMRPALVQRIVCSYTQYGWLAALVESFGAEVADTVYTDEVTLTFRIDADKAGSFAAALTDRSAGTLAAETQREEYRTVAL